jgi:hypothetical protein
MIKKKEEYFKCSLCGYKFSREEVKCPPCPMASKCNAICCPNCGAQVLMDSRFIRWLKKVLRIGGKNG